MSSVTRRSLITRIRERFRYRLVAQEILDSLHRRLSIIICPYYLVAESLRPEFEPRDADAPTHTVRFLGKSDVEVMKRMGWVSSSASRLDEAMQRGKCLGIFVEGQLAGYMWSRTDSIPLPNSLMRLATLTDDEAYLSGAFVARDFRGHRLAASLRHRLYKELGRVGRTRLYSISLAFNRSARRFKARLGARELELRVVLGIAHWRAMDVRLRKLDGDVSGPGFPALVFSTPQS